MKVYNSLTKKKEEFIPLHDKKVGMYTCGPTVYNYAHIGNLRAFIFADSLRRVLEVSGYDVKQVMNITDVGHLVSDDDEGEDKMLLASKKENKDAWSIAKFYEEAFKKDMKALEIQQPNVYCRVTDHIPQQIALVKKLEKKGYTYKIEDGIYFDTSKFSNYGKMSTMDLTKLKEGARIGKIAGKKNPTDFALWKFSEHKRQMVWDSPWGIGFPGWHLECSALSMKYLGESFDLHTGGVDHLNIHHPNEIAQSEAATGKQFVKYWMHNEFLVLKQGKMAKSKNNFLRLQSLLDQGYSPMHYKYFCLGTHYRQQLMYSTQALDSAKHSYERLKELVSKLGEKEGKPSKYYKKFLTACQDDLNIPVALSAAWEMLRDNTVTDEDKLSSMKIIDETLGLKLFDKEEIPKKIMDLVQQREQARNKKDYSLADELRNKILKQGYVVQDKKSGVSVKRKA